MLDTLVHADGSIEHNAFTSVLGGTVYRCAPQSHCFSAQQDSLRVQTLKYDLEAFTLSADAIFLGLRRALGGAVVEPIWRDGDYIGGKLLH